MLAKVAGLTALAEQNDPMSALLLDIQVLFLRSGAGRMFTRDLLAGLNSLPDRPWAVLKRGKEINDQWLAKQLHPHGIGPRTIRLEGAIAKGYVEEDFTEVFERYISQSEIQGRLEEDRGKKGDPPSSDSGATGDGEAAAA